MRLRTMLALWAHLLCACGESGPGTPGDAAVDAGGGSDAGTDPGFLPTPPAPPEPPSLTPCPDGWREVSELGIGVCEPWPGGGMQACGRGEAHMPGTTGCAPVGEPCPAGDFPDVGAATNVAYASPNGATPAAGTAGDPNGSIADAIAAVVSSGPGVVALSKGIFDEDVAIPFGVTVRGACAGETILRSVSGGQPAGVFVRGQDAALEDVTVTGVDVGVGVDPGVTAVLRRVVIEDVLAAGIVAESASVTAEDLVVRRVRTASQAGVFAAGIRVTDGGRVDVTRAVIEDTPATGIDTFEAGEVRLADTAIRATRPDQAGDFGRAMLLYRTPAVVSRCVFEDNLEIGVSASRPESSVQMEDVIIRRTGPHANTGELGRGLQAQFGATIAGVRVRVMDNRELGLASAFDQSRITLEDALIARTLPQEATGDFGQGVLAYETGVAALTRALIAENHTDGALALGAGANLVLIDATIRDSQPNESLAMFGRALELGPAPRPRCAACLSPATGTPPCSLTARAHS